MIWVCAAWVGFTVMVVVGAGLENPHSFAFPIYCGLAVAALLCWLTTLVRRL